MLQKMVVTLLFALAAAPAIAEEVYLLPTPCRVLDTRVVGGTLAAGTALQVEVRGTPGAAQGGETGCGIPEWATGALVSLVAIQPAASGYARLWADGASEPLESSLNFGVGTNRNDSLTVKLGAAGDLLLKASQDSDFVLGLVGWTGPNKGSHAQGTIFDIYDGGTTIEVALTNGQRIWCEEAILPLTTCTNLQIGALVTAIGHPVISGGAIIVVAHELTSP